MEFLMLKSMLRAAAKDLLQQTRWKPWRVPVSHADQVMGVSHQPTLPSSYSQQQHHSFHPNCSVSPRHGRDLMLDLYPTRRCLRRSI